MVVTTVSIDCDDGYYILSFLVVVVGWVQLRLLSEMV